MNSVGIQSKGTSPILLKDGGMPTRRKSSGNYRSTKSGAGMTQKGVMAYRRKNPGSKLKTAVTGKVKKGSKAANRRKSYCARSLGQLKRSSAKTRNDPNLNMSALKFFSCCKSCNCFKYFFFISIPFLVLVLISYLRLLFLPL